MAHTISNTCTGCTACVRICPVHAIDGTRNQLHRIEAAKCIDCGACGRICPVDCVLNAADRKITHIKRSQWPKPVVILAGCISCGVCLQACPVDCLDWGDQSDARLHVFPELVSPEDCIACEFCSAACPVDAIVMTSPLQKKIPSVD